MSPRTVVVYRTRAGKEPFTDWFSDLRDGVTRRRILRRLLRLEEGNLGDYKSLGGGVKELRFSFGAGYRIYFGEDDSTIVILPCGGDKDSQRRDVQQARVLWEEYQSDAQL